MGIPGLHKGLSFATQKTTLQNFRGKSLAVDASSWLHRSVYSVSEKYVEALERGQIDEQCVRVSAAYVSSRCRELLEAFQITQIFLVMDGKRCPLKADTNGERERRRQANLTEARQYKRQGRNDKAEEKYKTCIKIKDELTNQVMAVVKKNFRTDNRVHLIWSPYEADAQLAKLCIDGVADAVITEDSDVLVYSAASHCSFPIIFKLDRQTGTCDVISMDWLLSSNENQSPCPTIAGMKPPGALEVLLRNLASRQNRRPGFGVRLFVQGCVLAGCDYAPNKLAGVGLVNAFKHVRDNAFRNDSVRFSKVLDALPRKNKVNIDVQEYELNLARSEAVFYYHIVQHQDHSTRPLCEPRTCEKENDSPHCYTHHFPLMERFGNDWSFIGESTQGPQSCLAPLTNKKALQADLAPPIKEIAFVEKGERKNRPFEGTKSPVQLTVSVPTALQLTKNPYAKSEQAGTNKRERDRYRAPLDTIDPNSSEVSQPGHINNLFSKYARTSDQRDSTHDQVGVKNFQNTLGEVRCVKRDFSSDKDRSLRLAGSTRWSGQPSTADSGRQYTSERANKMNVPNDCDRRNAPSMGFEYGILDRIAPDDSRRSIDGPGELPLASDQFSSESLSAPSSDAYPTTSDTRVNVPLFFDLTDSNPATMDWNFDGVDNEEVDRRKPARVSLDDSVYSRKRSHTELLDLAPSYDFQSEPITLALPSASSAAPGANFPKRSKYFSAGNAEAMLDYQQLSEHLPQAITHDRISVTPQTKHLLFDADEVIDSPDNTGYYTSNLVGPHPASSLSTRFDSSFRSRPSTPARRPQSGPLADAFRKQIEKPPSGATSQDRPWVRSFRPLAGRNSLSRTRIGKIDSYFSVRNPTSTSFKQL